MIIKFVIAAILLYLLYRIARHMFLPANKKVKPLSGNGDEGTRGEDLVEDPFCHTYTPISEAHKLEMNGRTVYFCSKKCLENFQRQAKEKREDA